MSKSLKRRIKYFTIGFTNAFDMTGRYADINIEVEAKPFGYYANRQNTSEARKKITSETAKRISSAQ